MNYYEVVFILKQDASASHVEKAAQECASIINEFGGEITKTEFCGLRYLAYPIKKNKRGHYVLLNVASPNADVVKELERKFNLDEDVLRGLIVKVKRLDNSPSVLIKRNYRDGRESGGNMRTAVSQSTSEGE